MNVRFVPTGQRPLDAAQAYEDWSEIQDPGIPHLIVPATARLRREQGASDGVELSPHNPYRALVVRKEPGGTLVIAAADTPFAHRILEILGDD